jgi:site-specific DNA recombinase
MLRNTKQSELVSAGEPTRAAIYIRVSSEEQVSGYGLDVQRERCRAQAIAKGWSIAGEYEDAGISGTKDASARPGLAGLVAAAEIGNIDAVIVLALDRLGRRTRIVLDLVDQLAVAGVDIVSCKESLDTTTPAGRFVLTMFAALAQLERDNIVERTTAGRNVRGKKDGDRGGRLPYGYVRSASGLVVDPDAAGVVKRIFRLRAERRTLRDIAAIMQSPSPRGGAWFASGVREILINEPAYRGGSRGESAEHWPAIL